MALQTTHAAQAAISDGIAALHPEHYGAAPADHIRNRVGADRIQQVPAQSPRQSLIPIQRHTASETSMPKRHPSVSKSSTIIPGAPSTGKLVTVPLRASG